MSSFVLSFEQTWLHTIINNDLKLDAILLFLLFYPSPVSFPFLFVLLAVYVRTTHFLTFFRSYFCPFILYFFHPWLSIIVGLVVSFTNSCRYTRFVWHIFLTCIQSIWSITWFDKDKCNILPCHINHLYSCITIINAHWERNKREGWKHLDSSTRDTLLKDITFNDKWFISFVANCY